MYELLYYLDKSVYMPSNISVNNSLPLTQLLTKDSRGAQERRDVYCFITSEGTQLADEDVFLIQ